MMLIEMSIVILMAVVVGPIWAVQVVYGRRDKLLSGTVFELMAPQMLSEAWLGAEECLVT